MANYPTTAVTNDTRITPDAGLVHDRAVDGTPRSRSLYTETVYELDLIHEHITGGERDGILSHYDAHKGVEFNWVSPWGDTYACRYADEPHCQAKAGGYWNVTTPLIGTKV